jgi:hypothetical protein
MPVEALLLWLPTTAAAHPRSINGVSPWLYPKSSKEGRRRPSLPPLLPTSFRRLYRAFVQPRRWPDIELTAFVEASSRQVAIDRIAAAIATLEYSSTVESVSERIYNCASAIECVAQGLSEDRELRIFETGWGGGKAICFVEHPLFLVPDPAPLCRKWAQIPQSIED